MLINLKTLTMVLLATLSTAQAYSSYEASFERNIGDDELKLEARAIGLSHRSHADAALDYLTTREIFEELYLRMERKERTHKRSRSQLRFEALLRCRRLIAKADDPKNVKPLAADSIKNCRKLIARHDGVVVGGGTVGQ